MVPAIYTHSPVMRTNSDSGRLGVGTARNCRFVCPHGPQSRGRARKMNGSVGYGRRKRTTTALRRWRRGGGPLCEAGNGGD